MGGRAPWPCVLRRIRAAAAAVSALLLAAAAPLTVPFDFSHQAIGLHVVLNGTPLFVLLDTGVDPSTIDLARARALGLRIDTAGGHGEGFGEGAAPAVFPTSIAGLSAAGRPMRAFDALATDLTAISRSFGRPVDAVLGASFLADKAVLLDYPARTVTILQRGSEARPLTHSCRLHWSAPMRTQDGFPMIPGFRLGAASAPVSLDTGSTGGVGLFQSALALPGVQAQLVQTGDSVRHGFRGVSHVRLYRFNAAIALGPFILPPGQPVVLRPEPGSSQRVANIGNAVFAAMNLRLLMDYPNKQIAAFGQCGPN